MAAPLLCRFTSHRLVRHSNDADRPAALLNSHLRTKNRSIAGKIGVQHPKSDGGLDASVMLVLLLISVVGSVVTVGGIVVFPAQGDAEGTFGVGTMICGLWPEPPASVAAEGIVASLNVDSVIEARPGIGVTAVLLKNSEIF
jgi:hypothetical protein